MTGPGPIDVDIVDMDPADMARLIVSRAVSGNDMAWAEIHWDVATRYPRNADLVVALAGFIEQLLGMLADQVDQTPAQLWRDWMLHEALHRRQP